MKKEKVAVFTISHQKTRKISGKDAKFADRTDCPKWMDWFCGFKKRFVFSEIENRVRHSMSDKSQNGGLTP